MSKVCVIGSLNVDYMISVDRLPQDGETIIGNKVELLPGGKGLNQAVCASKLGSHVHMIGCIGNDDNGKFLQNVMSNQNMLQDGIEIIDGINSGCAFVRTSKDDNSIVVIKGSNDCFDREVIDKNKGKIDAADIVLVQLEIPLDTVYYLIDYCNKNNKKIILNPAPACKLREDIIQKVTYITPNETECELIFDMPYKEALKLYPNKIIMTAGSNGTYYYDGTDFINVKPEKVDVVDTTGAGDAFNGALATALSKNMKLYDAIKIANKIAGVTIQYVGAQSAPLKNIENYI